jgi:MoxR-like ATPase
VRLVAVTRKHPELVLGAGPRATKALFRASQVSAALSGREHVLPDDVKELVPAVLRHRLILGAEGRLGGRSATSVLDEIVAQIPAPVDTGLGRPAESSPPEPGPVS